MTDRAVHDVDVCIVGAGVAGLYCGYSLLSRSSPLLTQESSDVRIAVLESSQRIGGRLWTVSPPQAPHLKAELGGMRFKSTQTLLVDLIQELGLRYRSFPLGDMSDGADLHFLRRHRFSLDDLKGGHVPIPYPLSRSEQGRSVQQLLGAVIKRLVPDVVPPTDQELQNRERTQCVNGTPIHQLSTSYFLGQSLSAGAYSL